MKVPQKLKLGDKLLFSLGPKQQCDFGKDFRLDVNLSSHPLYIQIYAHFFPPIYP